VYLDGKECLVRISWVSLEEARQKLEISAWGVDAIELACTSEVSNITRVWIFVHAPLLRNIFAPGGRLSMPAFNDAKASSSEIGGSRHLWTGLREIVHEIQKKGTRHHHQTVLKIKEKGDVNDVGDDLRREWVLTPIFPTARLDAVPPS
jgi:hypothetical protein